MNTSHLYLQYLKLVFNIFPSHVPAHAYLYYTIPRYRHRSQGSALSVYDGFSDDEAVVDMHGDGNVASHTFI